MRPVACAEGVDVLLFSIVFQMQIYRYSRVFLVPIILCFSIIPRKYCCAHATLVARLDQELHRQGSPDIVIGIAGNKADLASTARRVSSQEAAQFAEENGCVFFETSAKTGENVKEIVLAIGMLREYRECVWQARDVRSNSSTCFLFRIPSYFSPNLSFLLPLPEN